MAHIYLIRHGQASFGTENYDKLSEIGNRQAGVVGDYFSKQNTPIAHVVHGEMSRQKQTAKILATQASFSSKLVCHPSANEFDSDNLIKHYLPILAKESTELSEILNKGEHWWAGGDNFELFFRAMVELWQMDKACPFESWSDFRLRCFKCLNDVAEMAEIDSKNSGAGKKGATILATSGGLISVIMQSILNFENSTFMDMNMTINNASISEVMWSTNQNMVTQEPLRKRNRLLSFNNITHLLQAKNSELITRK